MRSVVSWRRPGAPFAIAALSLVGTACGAATAAESPAERAPSVGAAAPVEPAPEPQGAVEPVGVAPSPEPLVGCEADLPPTETLAAFRAATDDLRACYERELARDRGLRVSVHLRMRVDMSGRVTEAHIAEELPPPLKACLIEVGSQLSFPPAIGGRGPTDCAMVVAPVNFRPQTD